MRFVYFSFVHVRFLTMTSSVASELDVSGAIYQSPRQLGVYINKHKLLISLETNHFVGCWSIDNL